TSALAADAIVGWVPWPSLFKRHLAATTLQFIVLTLAGGALAAWWVGRNDGSFIPVSPRIIKAAVFAAIVAYASGLSYLSLFRHQALLTCIWDLAYFALLTWELSQLRVLRSSIWNVAAWGNHATFILAVASPFF